MFANEIAEIDNPAQWERKGASIFRENTFKNYPQQIRVFGALVRRLQTMGGKLFYYADEKPQGTPRQTNLDTVERESSAMKQTLNRLARYAETAGKHLVVMMDQVNEKQRIQRMPVMYAHMFSRQGDFEEMKRIVEPPMHLDSSVSANIQFADWVAAAVSRAVDFQLIEESNFLWITSEMFEPVRGSFTSDSKLHLNQRSVEDIFHSRLFYPNRALYPIISGQRLGAKIDPEVLRKIMAASAKSKNFETREPFDGQE